MLRSTDEELVGKDERIDWSFHAGPADHFLNGKTCQLQLLSLMIKTSETA